MTDDECSLFRFVIENFHCVPRELKRRITAVEWQKILIVHRKGFIGSDRRDVGLAKAAEYIGRTMGGDVDAEALLPVKIWDRPEQSAEEIAGILSGLSWQPTSQPSPSNS